MAYLFSHFLLALFLALYLTKNLTSLLIVNAFFCQVRLFEETIFFAFPESKKGLL